MFSSTSTSSSEWYYPTLTASVEVVPFWKFMNLSSYHHLQCWAAALQTVTWCWRRPRGNSRRPATPRNTPIRRPVSGPCRPPLASSSSSPSLTLTWRRRRAASMTGSWWTRETQTLSSAVWRPTGWRWIQRGTWWSCPLPPTSVCRRGGSVLASDTVGSGWHQCPVLKCSSTNPVWHDVIYLWLWCLCNTSIPFRL